MGKTPLDFYLDNSVGAIDDNVAILLLILILFVELIYGFPGCLSIRVEPRNFGSTRKFPSLTRRFPTVSYTVYRDGID